MSKSNFVLLMDLTESEYDLIISSTPCVGTPKELVIPLDMIDEVLELTSLHPDKFKRLE